MKIPDKIYVSEELLKEHNWNQTQCKDTEYIRKGALMEWVKEKKSHNVKPHPTPVDGIKWLGKEEVLNDLIDKLNEM